MQNSQTTAATGGNFAAAAANSGRHGSHAAIRCRLRTLTHIQTKEIP